jgi:hypothetical protein
MVQAPAPDELTGRCLCGATRFHINGRVGAVGYCHCGQCRRASGTAFASNANVARANIEFLSGLDEVTEYESSPGKFRAFCSRCGSPVYSRSTADPDNLRIRLGLLDQDPGRRALAHLWVSSKAPWFDISDQLPQFPEGPPPRPQR